MRIRTQHGALLIDPSTPRATPVLSYGPWLYSKVGLGALGADTETIAVVAAQGAATTASILGGISAATTAAGTGFLAGATVFGMAASAAIPLIGAAVVGLVEVGMLIANQFQGCGQTCIAASNIANQVEAILLQNLNHYMSSPVHYRSLQLAALNNFDTAWRALTQACGNQQLMQAGVNCIENRQQGACFWKTSPAGWVQQNGQWVYQTAGLAGSGDSCWNWFVGYRDGIANDPTVVSDPQGGNITDALTGQQTAIPGGNAVSYPANASTGLPMPLLLGGAALAAFLLMRRN